MGVLPSGVLDPKLDQFLESAAVGEVSGIIETLGALHLLQRIEHQAAVRQIFIEGKGEGVHAQLLALRSQALEGASFRDLAREHSMDRSSAERGGDYAVFERGPRDSLLKRVAFELAVGEISPPIETPLGWHLLKRVVREELPSELIEENWARFNVLLITHADSPQAANPNRSRAEARELAAEVHALLSAGDPFEPIARFSNDDPGGKERAGDIGWVHRRMPGLPQYLRTSFLLKPGEIGAPLETGGGWILVQRTR
jgi:parvulin-like peptidyl-prolyl isomerase